MTRAALILIVASLTLGVSPAPWVDPNVIQGTLLFSGSDVYVGYGLQCWGTVADPCGFPVTMTLTGVPASLTRDPNGAWSWLWRPTAADVGTHYAVLTATDYPFAGGKNGVTVATVPIRVLSAPLPPVITGGGCKIVP